MRKIFVWGAIVVNGVIGLLSYFVSPGFIWLFALSVPTTLQGIYDMVQRKRTIVRNFPLVGRGRYWMEILRPKIYQYFIESDTDGTPISRIFRSIIYQRAKLDLSTTPFGTQLNVNEVGYEWINHSMNPLDLDEVKVDDLRVTVGGPDCKQPYSCSIFNISAMSYGALSKTAVEALNWGARDGNFAHNTGEGSISPFHLKHGGDLIWQIGTGYFGCRTKDGNFSPEKFQERALLGSVKMIEVKLSQGAKPGHGGILPAEKNTPEIAEIRGVDPGVSVMSPSRHHAFDDNNGLLDFIAQLRELSGGKPVGFKICFGNASEFEDLCETMVKRKVYPDFITIDGGEGGTGAAPLEFSNSIGMSLRDGLVYAKDILDKHNLTQYIKIIAGGKLITGFHLFKALAMGADICYSARGMMIALGCIQALECNTNHCPTGVATQDPALYVGLDPDYKHRRIKNYHHGTIESVAEIMCAAGIRNLSDINRTLIWHRTSETQIQNYEQMFPSVKPLGHAGGLNSVSV